MRYSIRHLTTYNYHESANTAHNRLCLVPLTLPGQTCVLSEIRIVPHPDEHTYHTDFFGNTLQFISVYKEHSGLQIESLSTVDLDSRFSTDVARQSTDSWQYVRNRSAFGDQYADVVQYTLPSVYVPYMEAIQQFGADCFPNSATLWQGCLALMKKIYSSIEFRPGFTTVNTPVDAVLKIRKGVCQDFAHLMIACLRNLGIPARYVSGYIETLPPPGKEKLVGSDASHAWVAVYFPEVGWIEFDPTNNLVPSDNHIRVGFGRDYFDVAPITGIIFSSGKQTISVQVDVNRV